MILNSKRFCFAGAFWLVVSFFAITDAYAQGAICPPNLDFENGDFTNWACSQGYVVSTNDENVVMLSSSAPGSVHTIIPAGNRETDEYGFFPKSCPNGSGFSVKLGNNIGGHEAEGLSYTYSIPAGIGRFSIIYNYAVVLQNPNHLPSEQPRFRAKVIDVSDNTEINCVSFDFTASSSLPGFKVSPVASDVLYKDWTPITVDLSDYAGKTIRLEFITSDCTFNRHFGYAYVDVNSNCSGTIIGSTLCEGDTSITLTAPYGFQSYQWYSNNSFTNLIGASQTLPPIVPAIGSVFPVVVTPYPGFGCEDTLYATINTGLKPYSDAGPDRTICSKEFIQIGTIANPNYSYTWIPINLLSNPGVANPGLTGNLLTPVQFIVRTTDIITGCFSFDTTLITPKLVDTSSSILGRQFYCPGETFSNTITVNNPFSSGVQWYRNNSIIGGATNLFYQVQSGGTGSYWAQILQNGCIDSTRQYEIAYSSTPKANFNLTRDIQCINIPVSLVNTTTIATNDLMTYLWKFSDGSLSTDQDVSKTFTSTGVYTIKLIATSSIECTDSIEKTISIQEKCVPYLPSAFTPNGDGLNDIIKPYLAGIKTLKRFAIYNRFGNIVFSTNKEGEGWDGTYKGTKLDPGVFVWILEYIAVDDRATVQKGTLTLIR